MKIIFITNFVSFHQISTFDYFYSFLNKNDSFIFIKTADLTDERKKMNYIEEEREFIVDSRTLSFFDLEKIFNETDFVIFGSCEDKRINKLLKKSKNLFFMNEHYFKKIGLKTIFSYAKLFYFFNIYLKNVNKYYLCNSFYGGLEYKVLLQDRGHIYKFGYFPTAHFKKKIVNNDLSFLWVGRLLDWKKPILAVKLIKKLVEKKLEPSLLIIGSGPEEKKLKKYIENHALSKYILIKPFCDNQSIIKAMYEHQYYLFTSGHQEGWGVVLNETLSCGSITFANKYAGSSRMLINDRSNGFLFNGKLNDLVKKVLFVRELDLALRERIAKNAQASICSVWSSKNAGFRLFSLFESMEKDEIKCFEDGILSNF